ncbi:MAG: serine/threonine-protein kinase [bacterium]
MTDWYCRDCGVVPRAAGEGEACRRHPEQVLFSEESPQVRAKDGLLGRLLAGRYAVFRKLGKGGMGAAYQARDRILGRMVAIKVPQDDADLDRFWEEGRVLARLHHPAIVAVHDLATHREMPLLVLAWVDGVPFGTLEGHRPPTGLRLVLELLDGLQAAHEAGVVHRDLKPANLLVTRSAEPRLVIIDFGIARAADGPALTRTGGIVGTPRYIPPDAGMGAADAAYDLYAVGLLLADLYTPTRGTPVFPSPDVLSNGMYDDASVQAHFREKRQGVGELPPAMPAPIGEVVRWCLQPGRASRPQTAAELADVLRQAIQALDPPTLPLPELALTPAPEVPAPAPEDPPPAPEEPASPARPLVARLAPLAAGLIVAGVLGWWLGRAMDPDLVQPRAAPAVVEVHLGAPRADAAPARDEPEPAATVADAARPGPPNAALLDSPDAARPLDPDAAPPPEPDASPPDAGRPRRIAARDARRRRPVAAAPATRAPIRIVHVAPHDEAPPTLAAPAPPSLPRLPPSTRRMIIALVDGMKTYDQLSCRCESARQLIYQAGDIADREAWLAWLADCNWSEWRGACQKPIGPAPR